MTVVLTWTDTNSAEDGYGLYRSLSPMDPAALPAPLVTLGANTTQYQDVTAVAGTTYYYRVAGYAGALVEVGAEVVIAASSGGRTKLALSFDVLAQDWLTNLTLSGDAQTGSDVLLI